MLHKRAKDQVGRQNPGIKKRFFPHRLAFNVLGYVLNPFLRDITVLGCIRKKKKKRKTYDIDRVVQKQCFGQEKTKSPQNATLRWYKCQKTIFCKN